MIIRLSSEQNDSRLIAGALLVSSNLEFSVSQPILTFSTSDACVKQTGPSLSWLDFQEAVKVL